MLMAGESIPTGWLLCNAAAVSRTGATKALFETIGTTWGVGNGSTTFNLPGSENRILIGVGIAGPGRTKHELGKTGGVETVTLTGNQSGVPEHSHLLTSYFGLWASANSISAHYWESGGKYAAGVQGESYAPYSGAISGVGASSAHNNMPYYAPLSWLVKT
jgi:microcystin-dependent protein